MTELNQRTSKNGLYQILMAFAIVFISMFYDGTLPFSHSSTTVTVEAATQNGWVSSSGGTYWYYYENGSAVTGWKQISGTWYYFDGWTGAMVTGWQSIGGVYYYFVDSGAMRTGWLELDDEWYYLNTSGVMQVNWQQINGSWYYFRSSGVMQTGWMNDGRWYYFHSDGQMATNEWVTDDTGEPYFFKPSGGYESWSNLKYGTKTSNMDSGKKLVYDVYSKSSAYGGNGYQIQQKNGKPHMVFRGWSALFGHKHHNAGNNETYIVAQNSKDRKKVHGYNTKQLNFSASEDLEYNKAASTDTTLYNKCGANVTNTSNLTCNMEYENVGWEVSIPLDDLFPNEFAEDTWRLYIVKRVDDQVVYDELILPFHLNPQSFKQGKVDLTSGINATTLTMNADPVVKRTAAYNTSQTTGSHGKFIPGSNYTQVDMVQSHGAAIWFGVWDPAAGSTRYAPSTYWTFGGEQAVINYKPNAVLPVANFSVSPSPLYNDTLAKLTNSSYDPAGDKLTYIWWYMKPGTTNWVEFSTATHPNLTLDKKGDWKLYLRATNTRGQYKDIEKTVNVGNRKPTANFTYMPSYGITENTVVTYTSVANDADKDNLNYTWWYMKPGTANWVEFSKEKHPNLAMDKIGTWQLFLRVSDGTTYTDVEKPVQVVKGDGPPLADFDYSPSTIYNDTLIKYTNKSSDPDGDTLTYEWAYQLPLTSNWYVFSTQEHPTSTFNKGSWNVRLTVSDGKQSATAVKTIPVLNRAPVTSVNVTPSTGNMDTLFTLSSTYNDPDGDSATLYEWQYQKPNSSTWIAWQTNDTAVNPTLLPSTIEPDSSKNRGTWKVRMRASDGAVLSAYSETSFTVTSRPPTVAVSVSPSTGHNDTTFTLTPTYNHPDGVLATQYEWQYQKPNSSTWVAWQSNVTAVKPTLKPTTIEPDPTKNKGTWKVRMRASDGTVFSAFAETSFTVTNRAPVANFTHSPTTIYNNTTVSFSNTSSDPDGDALTYQWAYQQPGSSTWTNFSTVRDPARVFNIKGTWNIRLTVNDGTTSHSVTKPLTVQNSIPITSVSVSPSTGNNETLFTFTPTYSDPDGDAATQYEWQYQKPNSSTWVAWQTNVTAVKPTLKPTTIEPDPTKNKGIWKVRMRASDGTVFSTFAETSFTVTNRAPVANFTHSPTTIYSNTTVTFTNVSSDPDGDALTYQWAYQEPGSSSWTNFSTVKDPSRVFNVKETWNIRLTVSDGTTSHSVTKPLTVLNRIPTTSVSVSPSIGNINTTFTFTPTYNDPDGDAATQYEWQYQKPNSSTWVAWEKYDTAVKPTLIPTYIEPDDTKNKGVWKVRMRASDGTVFSTYAETTFEVTNRPPTVTLSYSPNQVYEGDTVTLTATPTDLDGDLMTVTFEEEVNGSWVRLKQVNDVSTGQQITHQMKVTHKDYNVRVIVTDPHNASGNATVNFIPTELVIMGIIDHTDEWKAIHEEAEHEENQFYAGEVFLTEAVVTDHPIESVTVTFEGKQINGSTMEITETMSSNHPHYNATVHDEAMGSQDARLQNGLAYFLFTAKWENGVTKTYLTSVNIFDNMLNSHQLYRSN